MDYKLFAAKVIDEHKNPIVKFEIDKSKLFRCTNSEEESALFKNKLNCLKKILTLTRVERRCARCKADWVREKKLAHMIHLVGTKFQSMGFGNKEGKFLYPEEILYLIESNRAEIFLKGIPLNMREIYQELLSTPMELKIYQIYRELAVKGLCLQKQGNAIEEISAAKDEHANKKFKADEAVIKQNDVFLRLQSSGPKLNERIISRHCDYKLANSKLKFHLMFDKELDPKIGFYDDSEHNIYCGNDGEVTFNMFSNFQIPFLAVEQK